MKPIIITLILASVGLGAADTNRPVVAIYHSSLGWHSPRSSPQVVAALWSDGRIIWSATNGGAPYRHDRFSLEKLDALLGSLDRKGVFTNQALTRPNLGPDSSFTTIAIDDGRRRLKMASWHELAERHTNIVASADGLEPLEGRNRQQVLQSQPAEYRRFRSTWSEIWQSVTALIPERGDPYNEPVQIQTR